MGLYEFQGKEDREDTTINMSDPYSEEKTPLLI